MPDQSSGFTVTDRRKFTLEGDLREGAATEEASAPAPQAPAEPATAPHVEKEMVNRDLEPLPAEEEAAQDFDDIEGLPPEPTAAEHAAQDADYRASSRQLDDMIAKANPGARAAAAGRGAEMNFDKLVQSIYMTAALQLGAGAQPGEQPRVDILGARQSIDMLSVLVEKTKGNLSDKEQRLLQNALFELRMMFLEITNAIASSAHSPAAKPPVR